MSPHAAKTHLFSKRASVLLTVAAALGACAPKDAGQSASTLPLAPCYLVSSQGGETVTAACGTFPVWEDRDAKSGRKLPLRVAVLKATGQKPTGDALFILAGGPGQAATEIYPALATTLARVNIARDIVLVDQRGTGSTKQALSCPAFEAPDATVAEDEQVAQLAKCGTRVEGDPRRYTTTIAMDDLDDVRAALGYDRIDLYGGSYGTRAALIYVRRHPSHVRSVVLDGVAPLGWAVGGTVGRDAQRAMDLVLARCTTDAPCNKAFPDLAGSLKTLLAAHDAPVDVVIPHPKTAVPTHVSMSRGKIASTLHALSYTSETATLLPLLIDKAAKSGDLGPLAAQSIMTSELLAVSEGMHLAVLCSEDTPYFDLAHLDAINGGTYLGTKPNLTVAEICKGWPRASLSPEDRAPVVSDVPVLLLSGELDPITPPDNAAVAARTLSNSLQLTLPGEGHGVVSRGCMPRIVTDFIAKGSVKGLDTACLGTTKPLRFFTSSAGPPP